MKKFIILIAFLVGFGSVLRAIPDEGMWLPLYIKQYNEKKMQELGCKLTAEDIYNINNASIKDAILRLGQGFCTGELVSEQGLVFTNHHCGFDAIASLSTVESNFLEDGFWAYSFEDEIPIPDFTVSRLVYMQFINPQINEATEGMAEGKEKEEKIKSLIDEIKDNATKDNHYEAEVKTMFGGRDYYLLVYETFKDVRFVAAPPASVGKYGGDTDNWMWPRHTGDFSILRVYTAPDGSPAEYSEDNIPYHPIHHLKISLDGVKKNDFAMIMGYPGTTERYLSSYDIDYKQNKEQPALIDIFTQLLETMKVAMDADPAVKLELASDYAGLANYWKYLEGQNLGLKKYGLIEEYKAREEKIMDWMAKNPDMAAKYGDIFDQFKEAYTRLDELMPAYYYVLVGVRRSDVYGHMAGFYYVNEDIKKNGLEKFNAKKDEYKERAVSVLESKQLEANKASLETFVIKWYKALNTTDGIEFFSWIKNKYKQEKMEDNIHAYFDNLWEKSMLFNKDKFYAYLDKPNTKKFSKDIASVLTESVNQYFSDNIGNFYQQNGKINKLNGDYIEMYREFKKGENLYPDANSTLRMSYGTVQPYVARDAVYYKYYTTHYGILEKEIPGDEEFSLDPKLKNLLINKDFGPYSDNDTLYVCFLTNNDITGGNSGSPVMNADGNLIGLAFDGNWEAMTGDLVVDPKLNRTINVDIRYVLFVIDKLGGAKNLINELDIVKTEETASLPAAVE